MHRKQSWSPVAVARRENHKRAWLFRVLYRNILAEHWVEGRSVKGKGTPATWGTTDLRGLSSEIHSRGSTTHRRILDMSYKLSNPPESSHSWNRDNIRGVQREKELDCCTLVQSPPANENQEVSNLRRGDEQDGSLVSLITRMQNTWRR